MSIFLENMSFLANQCVGFCEMRSFSNQSSARLTADKSSACT